MKIRKVIMTIRNIKISTIHLIPPVLENNFEDE